jgi:hypothetical protein
MKNDLIKKIIYSNFNIRVFKKTEFKTGRNNKVFKILIKNKKYVLKFFSSKSYSYKSRMKREISFLKLVKNFNIDNVPLLISYSYKENYILISYLEGYQLSLISENELRSISNFIRNINKNKTKYAINAIDYCNSLKDHINLINKKCRFFIKNANLNKDISYFLKYKFLPKKKLVIQNIKNNINKKKLYKKITLKEKIISPSDLSLLNLKKNKKKLYYYDFEYAGLDDPLKLICDIICNPSNKFSNKNLFSETILNNFGLNKKNHNLLDLFIPLHKLKWCLIILNEFIDEKNKIRKFANYYESKKSKINKVNEYFNII